jgi:hypothetical protein
MACSLIRIRHDRVWQEPEILAQNLVGFRGRETAHGFQRKQRAAFE